MASDLEAARAWLTAHTPVDRERVALAGFGLGSRLVRSYCERSRDLTTHVLADSEPPPTVESRLRERLTIP